ncbi:hypothetical protein TRVL_06094 [Trypanosoma vivax]|nr:hypothetical protein TRVL_06094 [Trypanosoma vivax]
MAFCQFPRFFHYGRSTTKVQRTHTASYGCLLPKTKTNIKCAYTLTHATLCTTIYIMSFTSSFTRCFSVCLSTRNSECPAVTDDVRGQPSTKYQSSHQRSATENDNVNIKLNKNKTLTLAKTQTVTLTLILIITVTRLSASHSPLGPKMFIKFTASNFAIQIQWRLPHKQTSPVSGVVLLLGKHAATSFRKLLPLFCCLRVASSIPPRIAAALAFKCSPSAKRSSLRPLHRASHMFSFSVRAKSVARCFTSFDTIFHPSCASLSGPPVQTASFYFCVSAL